MFLGDARVSVSPYIEERFHAQNHCPDRPFRRACPRAGRCLRTDRHVLVMGLLWLRPADSDPSPVAPRPPMELRPPGRESSDSRIGMAQGASYVPVPVLGIGSASQERSRLKRAVGFRTAPERRRASRRDQSPSSAASCTANACGVPTVVTIRPAASDAKRSGQEAIQGLSTCRRPPRSVPRACPGMFHGPSRDLAVGHSAAS